MSRTVLVSFIGKGQRAQEGQPRSHTGYRITRYDFTSLGGALYESALFGLALLKHLRSLSEVQFYYGALDMTAQAKTPVLRIDFISDLVHATEAVATCQETGDYEPLAEFALQGRNEALRQIRRLIFEQRTNRPFGGTLNQAQQSTRQTQQLGNADPLRKSLIEFLDEEELSVVGEQKDRRAQLVAQADRAIQHRNYIVATALLLEAILSVARELSGKTEGNAKTLIDDLSRKLSAGDIKILHVFREVRNAIIHGETPGNSKAKAVFESDKDIQQLYQKVRDIYDRLTH